jgi:RND family efflux transporter MFP subunit
MMKKVLPLLIVIMAAILVVVIWRGHSAAPDADDAEGEDAALQSQVAHVEVVKLEKKRMTEIATAYGSVVAQPGNVHTISVAFETEIRRVLIAPGQLVSKGEPLFEIKPSPTTQLAFQQAKTAASTAESDLRQTTERHGLKLATNQELAIAQKAGSDAEQQLENLQKQGLGGENLVTAQFAGVVTRIDAQNGQTVPGGTSLAEVTAEKQIEVKLGVEPENVGTMKAGQPVKIFPVNTPGVAEVSGTVRLITRPLDPATRLVNVYVALPPETPLFLGGYVRGEVATQADDVLVAPRKALLPANGGFTLFTVKNGHATAHAVQAGLESDAEVQVNGIDLHAGDEVVVTGNYELEDGMAVATPSAK